MLALTNATSMVLPQLFRLAVDALEQNAVAQELANLAWLMVCVALAGAFFRIRSRVHLFYLGRDVEHDLRNDYYAHLCRLAPQFFDRNPIGDLMTRATYDLTQIRLLAGPGLLNVINTALAYIIALPLMFQLSFKLSLISLGIYLPALLIVARLSMRLYGQNRSLQEKMGELGSFVQESLSGAHVVRSFGIEEFQLDKFQQVHQRYYEAGVEVAFTRSYVWRLMVVFSGLGVLVTLVLGAQDVMRGDITLGELVALIEYLALLAWPSFALGWILSLYQRGKAALSRIGEILDAPAHVKPDGHSPATLEATIKVQDLSLELDGQGILHQLNFSIDKGKVLGIVGAIGSGKTSLIRCLQGHYPVSPNTIFIGGHDITTLNLDRVRKIFSTAEQEPALFSKSVHDNISFGDPKASAQDINNAVTQAALDVDLKALPEGLQTMVGDKGITLSGGQKQRTSLARALLVKRPILILDDILASVDAKTQTTIVQHLQARDSEQSTIIISHRVAAVAHADHIIVLESGRIIEAGCHHELLALSGRYAAFAAQQTLENKAASQTKAMEAMTHE
jgi:ATP-binding cassette, subfamily B, multidrug efflux pump